MKKIENYVLPEHTNKLYKEEAISSIGLTREIASKINELIDAYNNLSETDLKWKQTQEGIIRKGVLFMKDNLINSLNELLEIYEGDSIKNHIESILGTEFEHIKFFVTPQMFGAKGDGLTNDTNAIEKAINSLQEGDVLYFPKGTYLMTGKPVEIKQKHVTFMGDGLILCDYGFRPLASHFKALGLHIEATIYSQDNRAFMIDKREVTSELDYVENFIFKDCVFKNFF